MRLINSSLWTRVLLITAQLTVDGPGPYAVGRLLGKHFFVVARGKSGQAKQDIIGTHLILLIQGTLYCLRYLSKKGSSTVTSSKALSTWQTSTHSLSVPSNVCNLFWPLTWWLWWTIVVFTSIWIYWISLNLSKCSFFCILPILIIC